MACESSSPTIRNCRFIDNETSEFSGGAILLTEGSSPSIIDSYFYSNHAVDSGGALACYGSAPVVEDCTFESNTASYGGGGAVFSGWDGAPQLVRCTLDSNGAEIGGALFCYEHGYAYLANCLITNSTQGRAIWCLNWSEASLMCSDLFGNAGGDWVGSISAQLGTSGNICEDPLYCGDSTPETPYTLAEESPCAAAQQPSCGRIGAWPAGCSGTTDVQAEPGAAPAGVLLTRAYPNPFSSGVQIDYSIPDAAAGQEVRLAIYDAGGRLVATLAGGEGPGGRHSVPWNGLDATGTGVSAGVYFYRLDVGDRHVTRKLILVP